MNKFNLLFDKFHYKGTYTTFWGTEWKQKSDQVICGCNGSCAGPCKVIRTWSGRRRCWRTEKQTEPETSMSRNAVFNEESNKRIEKKGPVRFIEALSLVFILWTTWGFKVQRECIRAIYVGWSREGNTGERKIVLELLTVLTPIVRM